MSSMSDLDAVNSAETVLLAERLRTATTTRPRERVRITRRIVETTQTIEVPVRREEISVTREPLDGDEMPPLTGQAGQTGRDVEIFLRQEVATVALHVEAYQHVHVSVHRIDEDEVVEAVLRSEHVEVTTEGTRPT